jgi:MYXO-CTERM domain-containing protein
MDNSSLSVVLWLAAGAVLALLVMRRKKRNILK